MASDRESAKRREDNANNWALDSSIINDITDNNAGKLYENNTKEVKQGEKSTADKFYDDLRHTMRANGMVQDDMFRWDDHFNRMQWANPYFAIGNTREYLFFTKPDLNIMRQKNNSVLNKVINRNNFWVEMRYKYRRVISDLQVSARREGNSHDKHVFIPLLTNAVASQLDLPSVTADTTDTPANIYGTTMQYRKGSYKSDEGYDFSLDFIDAPWLDVYHFFKMWDEYETLKDLGQIGPPTPADDSGTTGYYRINKILHDQIAIYKIVVDGADMETILFYAKLTGCFPKSVPRDAFSSVKENGLIQYSVDWHAQFVEEMRPIILYEFDLLAKKFLGGEPDLSVAKKLYNVNRGEVNGGFRNHPYIHAVVDNTRPTGVRYLLKWYDNKIKADGNDDDD